jgi:hypothetical protein
MAYNLEKIKSYFLQIYLPVDVFYIEIRKHVKSPTMFYLWVELRSHALLPLDLYDKHANSCTGIAGTLNYILRPYI